LNTKRLSLTAFFIVLTLSIGLVSVNLLVSKSYAQNSALSQDGNSNAEQQTEQAQSSDQDNQAVSGESSILSGNNILCQDQDNSDSNVFDDFCNAEEISNPPSDGQLISIVSIHVQGSSTLPTGSWGTVHIQDPTSNIDITQQIQSQDRSKTFYFNIPVGDRYSVTVSFPTPTPERPITLTLSNLDEESDCVRNSGLQCTGTKIPEQTHLQVTARTLAD
jgi:hypothetical protein